MIPSSVFIDDPIPDDTPPHNQTGIIGQSVCASDQEALHLVEIENLVQQTRYLNDRITVLLAENQRLLQSQAQLERMYAALGDKFAATKNRETGARLALQRRDQLLLEARKRFRDMQLMIKSLQDTNATSQQKSRIVLTRRDGPHKVTCELDSEPPRAHSRSPRSSGATRKLIQQQSGDRPSGFLRDGVRPPVRLSRSRRFFVDQGAEGSKTGTADIDKPDREGRRLPTKPNGLRRGFSSGPSMTRQLAPKDHDGVDSSPMFALRVTMHDRCPWQGKGQEDVVTAKARKQDFETTGELLAPRVLSPGINPNSVESTLSGTSTTVSSPTGVVRSRRQSSPPAKAERRADPDPLQLPPSLTKAPRRRGSRSGTTKYGLLKKSSLPSSMTC